MGQVCLSYFAVASASASTYFSLCGGLVSKLSARKPGRWPWSQCLPPACGRPSVERPGISTPVMMTNNVAMVSAISSSLSRPVRREAREEVEVCFFVVLCVFRIGG